MRAGRAVLVACCCLAAIGAAGRDRFAPSPAGPHPTAPRVAARAAGAFQLFAAGITASIVNRVQCGFNAIGEQCTDATGSYTLGGGFWPKRTPDQYIFNGGLQVAAIVPGYASPPWAGDTVGAYFFDGRGDQTAGTPLTGLYDSRRADDLAAWPSAAYVRDTALFDASLIGARTASEQDTWVRFWDGNLALRTGRAHPMGILVDQRTLAWNAPDPGRDIVYVISRLINVTARDRTRYAGLAAAGYTPEDIGELARLGTLFHDSVARTLGIQLPDTGLAWTNLYVGMGEDPDVVAGGAGNYSSAVLPFAMGFAYHGIFYAPTWSYPSDVFRPPFARAPGLVGTKFLRAQGGSVTGGSVVTLFTNTTGGGMFPERYGVAQLWRMLAGPSHIPPSDGQCNAYLGTPTCVAIQAQADTRFYLATGPYPAVGGGQSVVVVVAYVFAAPVAAALTTDGWGHTLGSTSFDLKPGFPGTGPRLVAGIDTVRQIERVAGWLDFADANADGDVQTAEVRTLPYSLLAKAQVAQAVADAKFALPAAPAAPRFAVLPRDGGATVVWERSDAEVAGDPYFPHAADPLSPLYDPDYRRDDVEGYRVWRGTSLASMELVAQFDYAGTAMVDRVGQVFGEGDRPERCAPDLGVVDGCAADFAHGGAHAVPLAGRVTQVLPWGRALLADGSALVTRADTAVTGGGSGMPPLRDTGVPFAFADSGLRNGTTYLYAVTAFDVNSVASGPASQQSPLVARAVTPRAASSDFRDALVELRLQGGGGAPLDPSAAFPTISATDGTFSGPIPPANGGGIAFPALVRELVPQGEFTLQVDSVGPGFAATADSLPPPTVYFSVAGGPPAPGGTATVAARAYRSVAVTAPVVYDGPLVPYDSAQAARFGVALAADARMPVRFTGLATSLTASSPGVAAAAANGYAGSASRWLAHSRWFDEGGREPPHPTITPFASASHTNGALSGVSAIFSPLAYRLPAAGAPQGIPDAYRFYLYATIAAWHPADFVLRWGSGGDVTVTDVTHGVAVPFKGAVQPGYGFVDAADIVAAGVTAADLGDGTPGVTFDPSVASYYSLRTVPPVCAAPALATRCVPLRRTARLQPVDVTDDGIADGTGIALVVDGEPFYLLMSALPAAGTAWHLRAVGGAGMTATCTPALPAASADLLPGAEPTSCAGYAYDPPPTRSPWVPGLRYTAAVTRRAGVDTAAADLARVHTVPDPLYVIPSRDVAPRVRFVNLPERAIIRIYTASGILVTVLTHNDAAAGGEERWDLTNRGGRRVASGVYFYHVEAPDHRTRIGRLTIVQGATP